MHYSTLPRRRHYLVPSVAVFLADAGLASPARIVGAGTAPGHGATCFADARLLKPALCTRKSQDDENQLSDASVPHIQTIHSEASPRTKWRRAPIPVACLGPRWIECWRVDDMVAPSFCAAHALHEVVLSGWLLIPV